MNLRNILIGVSFLGLASLVGCTDPPPITSGKIIEKKYQPERKTEITMGRPFLRRKYTVIDDEDYIVIFGKNVDKKFRTRKVYVREEIYNSLKIGDQFDTTKISHEKYDPGEWVRHY